MSIKIFDQVETLLLQGLWPSEIKDRLRVASDGTVRQYCYRIMDKLEPAERARVEALRNQRGRPKGGSKEFFQRKPVSQDHIIIGAKLYHCRKTQKLSHLEFCEKYSFSNRVQLSTMEQGYHDFTLSELNKIASVLEIPVLDLIVPTPELEQNYGLSLD